MAVADLVRVAYAHGWAQSGGPLTDRVRVGMKIASAIPPNHLGVAETAEGLGYWEGIHAAVTERRDRLDATNLSGLGARWRRLFNAVDRDRLTRMLLRQLAAGGILEAHHPINHATTMGALAALIRGALERGASSGDAGWQTTRRAFRDALAYAEASGRTAAIAAAAKKLDHPGTGIDLAAVQADGETQLAHTARLWTDADQWINTLLGYQSRDIARDIASLEQPDEAQVRGILDDYLAGVDDRALTVAVEQLTSRAVIQGVLDLYAQSGVTTVYVEASAGACPRCLDIAARSPYRIGAEPVVPVHPNCRCDLHPDDQVLPESVITPYLRARS